MCLSCRVGKTTNNIGRIRSSLYSTLPAKGIAVQLGRPHGYSVLRNTTDLRRDCDHSKNL